MTVDLSGPMTDTEAARSSCLAEGGRQAAGLSYPTGEQARVNTPGSDRRAGQQHKALAVDMWSTARRQVRQAPTWFMTA
jgi:hypothetical protein